MTRLRRVISAGQRLLGRRTVSVVMTTYNGAAYLEEQLDSLRRQSRLPDQLIVSDDGSVDATLDILRRFAETAPFPVEISKNANRLGFALNFMRAARRAKGDIILFCDQDDVWHRNKIGVLARAMPRRKRTVLSHDIEIFRSDGPTMPSYHKYLHDLGLPPSVTYKGCSLAVSRSFIDFWGWPPEDSSFAHDTWLAALATVMNERRYVGQVLIRHRMHDANASGQIVTLETVSRKTAALHPGGLADLSPAQILLAAIVGKKTQDRRELLIQHINASAGKLDAATVANAMSLLRPKSSKTRRS